MLWNSRMLDSTDDLPVRKNQVSDSNNRAEAVPTTQDTILSDLFLALRYHHCSIAPTFLTLDCTLQLVSFALKTSSQKMAVLTYLFKSPSHLLHKLMLLFISRLCSIDDYKHTGQSLKYQLYCNTRIQLLVVRCFIQGGIREREYSQYCWIYYDWGDYEMCCMQLQICLKFVADQSNYAYSWWIFWQRQDRQVGIYELRHITRGIQTRLQPRRTISKNMPQIVARHLRNVMRPISPPAPTRIKATSPTIAPRSIHKQKSPLFLKLLLSLSLLQRSPESYHSCNTGMIVHVRMQTVQQRKTYWCPKLMESEEEPFLVSVRQMSLGTSRASAKVRTHVIMDHNLTCTETWLLAQQWMRQRLRATSSPYSTISQIITNIIASYNQDIFHTPMIEFIYTIFFFILGFEVLLFMFLNLPTPRGWKGAVINFISTNKACKKLMKLHIGVCIIAAIFFIDCMRTEEKFTLEKNHFKTEGGLASELKASFLSYTILKIQRNKYIAFMLIYASLALNAYMQILQFMYMKREKYEKEQKEKEQQKKEAVQATPC